MISVKPATRVATPAHYHAHHAVLTRLALVALYRALNALHRHRHSAKLLNLPGTLSHAPQLANLTNSDLVEDTPLDFALVIGITMGGVFAAFMASMLLVARFCANATEQTNQKMVKVRSLVSVDRSEL